MLCKKVILPDYTKLHKVFHVLKLATATHDFSFLSVSLASWLLPSLALPSIVVSRAPVAPARRPFVRSLIRRFSVYIPAEAKCDRGRRKDGESLRRSNARSPAFTAGSRLASAFYEEGGKTDRLFSVPDTCWGEGRERGTYGQKNSLRTRMSSLHELLCAAPSILVKTTRKFRWLLG